METHARRHHVIPDQENVYAVKGKSNVTVPVKRQGLGLRGALGDVNTNIQAQCDVNIGKVAVTTAEFEKKASASRAQLRSNYGHVQSKVDTGLSCRPPSGPALRPPLRREESTGVLARAAIRTRTSAKENQTKNTSSVQLKKTTVELKKTTLELKKTSKLPSLKEQPKEKEVKSLKPILKEPTESLGRLHLRDTKKASTETRKLNFNITPVKLPDDIEDIDAGDKDSPLLMSIYIKDIYEYLTQLEIQYPVEEDHLKNQVVVTGRMRATLIDWLVEVQRQFSLVLEVFHLTVGILDRYLQVVPNVQRNRLQLVGATAMYIASKYEEIYAPKVEDFVYVTDNAYTKEDMFQCEREILSKLGFCLARPIPLTFLRRFIKAAHGNSKNHHLAKYFVDLCLVEYSMAHYRPSELAAAALCLSLYLLSSHKFTDVWTPTLAYYSQYTQEHLQPIIKKIAQIVVDVEHSKYKGVYNKYLDVTLAKVSSLPQLKGDTIHNLIESLPEC